MLPKEIMFSNENKISVKKLEEMVQKLKMNIPIEMIVEKAKVITNQ